MEKKFREKSEAFFHLEVKMVEAKKKAIDFGPVFGVAFFGKRFEEKNKEKQNQSNDEYRPSPTTIIYVPYFKRKFPRHEESLRQPQGMDTIGAGSCAVHMLENSRSSIGARKSSKMLIQYKHLNLL